MIFGAQAYLIHSHDMTGEPKTGEELLKRVKSDVEYMEATYGVIPIGWCTDDGPDGKKMRRLLLLHWDWWIILVCWAHQINLVVGDFLSSRHEWLVVVKQATDIIVWFNNHSKALSWLRQEQQQTYSGRSWSLFLPIVTRWLAHYLTFVRLLKIKGAVKSCWSKWENEMILAAGPKPDARERAQQVLSVIESQDFWDKLE